MLRKLEKYNNLFDVYQKLLTEKQSNYFKMYYQKDYSLQEIADYYQVSRNAVYDQLKKTIAKLSDLEEKLKIVFKNEYRWHQYQRYLETKDEKYLKKMIEMEDENGIWKFI